MNKLLENNAIIIGFIIGFTPTIIFIILCTIIESTTKKECIKNIICIKNCYKCHGFCHYSIDILK